MKYTFKEKLYDALTIMGPSYLKKEYRNLWTPECPVTGYCYVVSEAIYYIMKDKGTELFPYVMRVYPKSRVYTGHPNESISGTIYDTHWFLKNHYGKILDYTCDQYDELLKYGEGRQCGFLTKQPSKRGAELIKLLHSLSGKLYEDIRDD